MAGRDQPEGGNQDPSAGPGYTANPYDAPAAPGDGTEILPRQAPPTRAWDQNQTGAWDQNQTRAWDQNQTRAWDQNQTRAWDQNQTRAWDQQASVPSTPPYGEPLPDDYAATKQFSTFQQRPAEYPQTESQEPQYQPPQYQEPQYQPPQYEQPQYQQPQYQPPGGQPPYGAPPPTDGLPPQRGAMWPWLAAAAAILLIVVGGAVFFYLQTVGSDSSSVAARTTVSKAPTTASQAPTTARTTFAPRFVAISGTVQSNDGTTLIVEPNEGGTPVTVTTNADTQVLLGGEEGVGAFKPGDGVFVQGDEQQDKTVIARMIIGSLFQN